ncbi:hypothetical protein BKA82DRAFT_20019 [Pisolithus tinctorius]|nr:hypothetical protein BKA82DRAFT_20019 [Pisolithus tinctorius]
MMASTDGESTKDPVVSSRVPQGEAGNLYRLAAPAPGQQLSEGNDHRLCMGGVLSENITRDSSEAANSNVETLRQCWGMFQSSLSAFHWAPSSRLTFVSSSPKLPGDAPPKIDWRHSHSFVQHQQVVAKLLELVNTLQDEEDQIFMAEKKALVSDIQEHQLYLGRIMKHEWSCHQAECTTDMTALSSDFPVIVKTGIYFYYPMLL